MVSSSPQFDVFLAAPLWTCSGSILALHHCRLCLLFAQVDVPVLFGIDRDRTDVR